MKETDLHPYSREASMHSSTMLSAHLAQHTGKHKKVSPCFESLGYPTLLLQKTNISTYFH